MPGNSVGIATDYGLDGPGSKKNSRWGRDFPPVQTGPGAHSASSKIGTGSFPGINFGRGVLLTSHPFLVPLSWKSRGIPLGHTRPVTGSLYFLPSYKALYTLPTRSKHFSLPWLLHESTTSCSSNLRLIIGGEPYSLYRFRHLQTITKRCS